MYKEIVLWNKLSILLFFPYNMGMVSGFVDKVIDRMVPVSSSPSPLIKLHSNILLIFLRGKKQPFIQWSILFVLVKDGKSCFASSKKLFDEIQSLFE